MRREVLRRAMALNKTEEEIWDELNRHRHRVSMQTDSHIAEVISPILTRLLERWKKELKIVTGIRFESPVEATLWMALKREKIKFKYQKKIGPYRVDFFFLNCDKNLVVEILGMDYHFSTSEQIRRDLTRRRYLQAQGYMVLEFPGSDIYRDVFKCVEEIKSFL